MKLGSAQRNRLIPQVKDRKKWITSVPWIISQIKLLYSLSEYFVKKLIYISKFYEVHSQYV